MTVFEPRKLSKSLYMDNLREKLYSAGADVKEKLYSAGLNAREKVSPVLHQVHEKVSNAARSFVSAYTEIPKSSYAKGELIAPVAFGILGVTEAILGQPIPPINLLAAAAGMDAVLTIYAPITFRDL